MVNPALPFLHGCLGRLSEYKFASKQLLKSLIFCFNICLCTTFHEKLYFVCIDIFANFKMFAFQRSYFFFFLGRGSLQIDVHAFFFPFVVFPPLFFFMIRRCVTCCTACTTCATVTSASFEELSEFNNFLHTLHVSSPGSADHQRKQ